MDARRSTGSAYAFGPFRLDPVERKLTRDGEPVPLRAKLFDTLCLLIEQAGRLYADEPFGAELEQAAYALDSTTIDLCLSLFPWAKFRRRKALQDAGSLVTRALERRT